MSPQPDLEAHLAPQVDPPANPGPKAAPYLLPPAARPEYFRDSRYKSPILAAVLSGMPGLGQVFLGYTRLGFMHAGTAAVLVCLMSSNRLGMLEPAVGIFLAFFWLYNMVDAYRRALLLNEAISRMETPELPDGFGAVSFGGRLAVGIGLIFVGLLTLLNLRFNISLAWLDQWWPAGLVLLGLYLVVRAVRDRQAKAEPGQE
ncbi:hypothetical protein GETHLI_26720 [Geothrix limicola]|uniref:DUF5668 domain-containing protein n=1 Tax=Geothrix limicola TaxID=2927978 RepID=A0ABQ5QH28_9BACT|nr:hypothetical protein [Geothrix limicola]GLH74170.1 hypothetical protein GETHLI_26720 [Geothrix limicola]